MAARGRIPYEGRSIQAPGMMRHGPFPGGLVPAAPHRPLEPLPLPELLEKKMAVEAAEAARLLRENQRLAAAHVALREDLIVTQKEMQRIDAHIGSIQAESDIQIRGLLEKIGKMESDIRASEMVKKELQQAHIEAQSLFTVRQELTAEIQLVTEELQKIQADGKRLPELNVELDGLRQEHQKLRAAFEYEKSSNVEQVEQMRSMEQNLISMAREVEKLRAEVMKAEKGTHVPPNSYGGPGSYGGPDPAYPVGGPGGGYMAGGYGHARGYGSGYPSAGYGHGGPSSYPQPYEMSQAQMTGGSPAVGGASYPNGYGRPRPQMSGVAAAPGGAGYPDGYHAQMGGVGAVASESTNHYGGPGGVGSYATAGGNVP